MVIADRRAGHRAARPCIGPHASEKDRGKRRTTGVGEVPWVLGSRRMPVGTEGRAHPPPPSKSLGVRASAPPRRARAQRALHFAARPTLDGSHPTNARRGGWELHPAPKAGRQQQTRCLQQLREWLASRRTTASQRVLSLESHGTCRGDPPERTRGSDLFLPVDDLRRSLASVQARGTRRRRRTKPASAARSRMPDDHDFQGHDAPTGTGFGGPTSWSITGRRVRAI